MIDLTAYLEDFDGLVNTMQNMVEPDGDISTDWEKYYISNDQQNTETAKRFGVSCVGLLDFSDKHYSLYGIQIGLKADDAEYLLESIGYSATSYGESGWRNFKRQDETVSVFVQDDVVNEIFYYNGKGYDMEEYSMLEYSDTSNEDTNTGYKSILAQYPASAQYACYNIDKDGNAELIVKDDSYYVYSYIENNIVLCGKLESAYGNCLYAYNGNGIVVYDGGFGSLHLEYLTRYTLTNGTIEWAEDIANTEECSMEELRACLQDYSPISDFHDTSDDSYL